MKNLFEGLGIEITQRPSEQHKLHDKLWLYKSVKWSEAAAKKRRKEKRGAREAEEEPAIQKKGHTYGPGDFYRGRSRKQSGGGGS